MIKLTGLVKDLSPLGFDPTRLGYTSALFKTKLGTRIAQTPLFRVPTVEEMQLSKIIDKAKKMQYTTNVHQDQFTTKNIKNPTQVVIGGVDPGDVAEASLSTNTINIRQPDALPFWRRKRYVKLMQGIAKHEGAHLTQPTTNGNVYYFDTSRLQPVTRITNTYYDVNPKAPNQEALSLLSRAGRYDWIKSPDEVMSEIANLGQLGLLKSDGTPTTRGLILLANRFNLNIPNTRKVITALEPYHNNFYENVPAFTVGDSVLNSLARDELKLLGVGLSSAAIGIGAAQTK